MPARNFAGFSVVVKVPFFKSGCLVEYGVQVSEIGYDARGALPASVFPQKSVGEFSGAPVDTMPTAVDDLECFVLPKTQSGYDARGGSEFSR